MRKRECEYCSCSDINCLIKLPRLDYYFCNGKGEGSKCHYIDFVSQTDIESFELPKENPFSSVDLRCYICGSRSMFQLGFVCCEGSREVYIACNHKCQYNPELCPSMNRFYTPLISNGHILSDIVQMPSEMHQMNSKEILEKKKKIYEQIGVTFMTLTQKNLPKALLRYDSSNHYNSVFKKFIHSEYVANSYLQDSLLWSEIPCQMKNSNEFVFTAPPTLFRRISIGSRISITSDDNFEFCLVQNTERNREISCVFESQPKWVMGKYSFNADIAQVIKSVSFDRQRRALSIFCDKNPPLNPVIVKTIIGLLDCDTITKLNKSGLDHIPLRQCNIAEYPKMNKSQERAAKEALSQHITFIQGPPGTGKTTVIASIVNSFVCAGIKPVLVLGQSNVTADASTKILKNVGLNVVRVFSRSIENAQRILTNKSEIWRFSSTYRAELEFGPQYMKELLAYSQKANEMEQSIISKADVVCTTCNNAGSVRFTNIFKAMIFDESGQCVDPDLLIGMILGAERVILVGDHNQLPPLVISQSARKAGYNMTLIYRLLMNGLKPAVLTTQYRMHPEISLFSSQSFYGGFIKNGVSAKARTWKTKVISWPNPEAPIMYWNVESKEETYMSAISYYNKEEAKCISQVIDEFFTKGLFPSDIGIITPYSGQEAYLKDNLSSLCCHAPKNFIDNIEISSVDAFQGREKNFIVFSCVRANNNCNIGFLSEINRLNVSITRAKYGLIIIGNAKTFMKNQTWQNLIMSFSSRRAFVEGSLESLKSVNNPLSFSNKEEITQSTTEINDFDFVIE